MNFYDIFWREGLGSRKILITLVLRVICCVVQCIDAIGVMSEMTSSLQSPAPTVTMSWDLA